jgi:hypothetical protein
MITVDHTPDRADEISIEVAAPIIEADIEDLEQP